MNKKYQYLVLLFIYIAALGIRIYWLSHKNGFHIDEVLSFGLSFCKDQGIFSDYDLNREYTGIEVKETGFISLNTGIKETFSDVYTLWKDNKDPPHTSLYYILLRLFCIHLKTADIKDIIFRGGLLNLILFTLSFIFYFLLIRMLIPDSKLMQYTSLLCAFLSPAAISNTMYFREYQIQETMYIILVYYFFKTFDYTKHIIDIKRKSVSKQFIAHVLITAFTLLSGYYTLIFIGMFGLYAVYVKCAEKKYREIAYYVLVLLCGMALAQLLYLKYLSGIVSYHTTTIKHTVFDVYLFNIRLFLDTIMKFMREYVFTWPVIMLSAVCMSYVLYMKLCKQKTGINKNIICIVGISIIYVIIILIIAPAKVFRYVISVFTFFILLPVLLIGQIHKKYKILSVIGVCILIICSAADAVNYNKIKYLFNNKLDNYKFTEEYGIPVYVNIINMTFPYIKNIQYSYHVPYFHNKQKYIFIKNIEDIQKTGYNELFIIIDKINAEKAEKILLKAQYDIVKNYPINIAYDDELNDYDSYQCLRLQKHKRTPHDELREELLRISKMLSQQEGKK